MKRIVVSLVLAGLAALPAMAQDREDAVRAELFRCTQALVEANWERFGACLADDITLFNPEIPDAVLHRLDGRAAVAAHFTRMFDEARKRSAAPPYFRIKPENLSVQMFGDVAVTTFEFERDAGSFGRRTFVWAKRDAHWRIVHIHASNTADRGPIH